MAGIYFFGIIKDNLNSVRLLTEKQEPKGTTTYSYNGDEQLVSMTEPDGRVTSYTYDKAGNRKSQMVQDNRNTTEISYTYNSQKRLKRQWIPLCLRYIIMT